MSDPNQPVAPTQKLTAFGAFASQAAPAARYPDSVQGRARLVQDAVGVASAEAGAIRLAPGGAPKLEWATDGLEVKSLLSELIAPRVVLNFQGQHVLVEKVSSAQAVAILGRSRKADAKKGCEWSLEVSAANNREFLWRFATGEMAQTLCFDGPSLEDGLSLIEANRVQQDLDSFVPPGKFAARRSIDDRRRDPEAK